MKPTVTQLLKLLDKPALLGWANKMGLKGVDISVRQKQSLRAGSSMHKQIEAYHLHKTPFDDEGAQRRFEQFMSDKSILEIEKNIETEYFVGRYDCKMLIGGQTYMCDFKTSSGVYFENKLQLVAYSMAEKCDALAIIQIPEFTLKKINIIDRLPYEQVLIALSHIHKYKSQIDNESDPRLPY